jgi:hypothetical protein
MTKAKLKEPPNEDPWDLMCSGFTEEREGRPQRGEREA